MNQTSFKLGLGIDFGMPEISAPDRIKIIADVGFDSVFTGYGGTRKLEALANEIEKNNLIYQSVHAPFKRIDKMWKRSLETKAVFDELASCVRDCGRFGIGIMICHVWIGFLRERPNVTGIRNFAALLDIAEKSNVKIAFENTEGERYLECLFEKLGDHPSLAFCIDTGHELCYNRGRDMIGKYGRDGKLVATHLNDNLGVTGKKITWLDDAHLLPFDGVCDWDNCAKRLVDVGYSGILTSELTVKSKPDRHENERYSSLSCEEYVKLAYERALRIAKMTDAQRSSK